MDWRRLRTLAGNSTSFLWMLWALRPVPSTQSAILSEMIRGWWQWRYRLPHGSPCGTGSGSEETKMNISFHFFQFQTGVTSSPTGVRRGHCPQAYAVSLVQMVSFALRNKYQTMRLGCSLRNKCVRKSFGKWCPWPLYLNRRDPTVLENNCPAMLASSSFEYSVYIVTSHQSYLHKENFHLLVVYLGHILYLHGID